MRPVRVPLAWVAADYKAGCLCRGVPGLREGNVTVTIVVAMGKVRGQRLTKVTVILTLCLEESPNQVWVVPRALTV